MKEEGKREKIELRPVSSDLRAVETIGWIDANTEDTRLGIDFAGAYG